MRVAVLECKGWEYEYDNKNIRVLIDLIQESKIEERTHPNGRILVLSRLHTIIHPFNLS